MATQKKQIPEAAKEGFEIVIIFGLVGKKLGAKNHRGGRG